MVGHFVALAQNLALGTTLTAFADAACQHIELCFAGKNTTIPIRPLSKKSTQKSEHQSPTEEESPQEEQQTPLPPPPPQPHTLFSMLKSFPMPGYSAKRTARFVTVVGLVAGTSSFEFTRFLNHALPSVSYGTVATKTVLDLCVYTPVIGTVVMGLNSALAGNGSSYTSKKLATDLPKAYMAAVLFWSPVNAVKFSVIPPHLQVAFTRFFGVLWDITFSYYVNCKVPAPQLEETEEDAQSAKDKQEVE
eukprot:TRINITY_DN104141_c0_g1_i1.p1 TRINITY_DN104141_c0_g1~~TRINITY_DN104141_c0_g1_i1.p1  ORF type:complete len:248 (-),score=32.30 TRINITY_DN104141_c0_g1_i1:42-785(-)